MAESFKNLLKGRREIHIGISGRKSSRLIYLPVWFLLDDDRILLLPVEGSRTNWFRNLEKKPVIKVRIDDRDREFNATILRDRGRVDYIIGKFKDKYGESEIQRWYGVFDVAVEVPLNVRRANV